MFNGLLALGYKADTSPLDSKKAQLIPAESCMLAFVFGS